MYDPRVGLPGGGFLERSSSIRLAASRAWTLGACSIARLFFIRTARFSTGGIAAEHVERRSHQSGALRHQAEIAQAFVLHEQVADQIAEKYLEEHAFLKTRLESLTKEDGGITSS